MTDRLELRVCGQCGCQLPPDGRCPNCQTAEEEDWTGAHETTPEERASAGIRMRDGFSGRATASADTRGMWRSSLVPGGRYLGGAE